MASRHISCDQLPSRLANKDNNLDNIDSDDEPNNIDTNLHHPSDDYISKKHDIIIQLRKIIEAQKVELNLKDEIITLGFQLVKLLMDRCKIHGDSEHLSEMYDKFMKTIIDIYNK